LQGKEGYAGARFGHENIFAEKFFLTAKGVRVI